MVFHAPQWYFWLYLATWAPFAACLAIYGFGSPWQETLVGRGLFRLYASLVAVLTLVLVVQIVDIPRPLVDVLRAVLLSFAALAGVGQLRAILRLQRERRCDDTCPRRRADDT